MRFFTPKANFLPLIASFQQTRKLPVVEIGCGHGELLLEMRGAGIKCLGIDPRAAWFNERLSIDLASMIIPHEAQDSTLIRTMPSTILVCRPCHGLWVEQTYRQMNPKSVFYYVGHAHNHIIDLGTLKRKLLSRTEVGNEGEKIWQVG